MTLLGASLLAPALPAQPAVPAPCAELPPPRATEELFVSLAVMAFDRKGEVRYKYDKDERAALLAIVQHLKSQLPVPPAPPQPALSSRFMSLDAKTKTYMPVLSPEVSFTLDDAGTVTGVEFGKMQPATTADTIFADVLKRTALDAKLSGLASRFGEKEVRLTLFTIFGRDSAGPKVAWAQTPFYRQAVPVYSGTDARPSPKSAGPVYPEDLRITRTNGEVTSKFVIGADGTVPRASIQILRTTDPQFGESVRAWLSNERFIPATINGCPVPSTVVIPNKFEIRY